MTDNSWEDLSQAEIAAMRNYASAAQRTEEYLKKFNRETTLKFLISNGDITIFDVGANEGRSAIEFKKWWGNARIHCFEPQSECWSSLSKLAERFEPGDIHINKTAVGNERDKELVFYSHDISTGMFSTGLSGFNKINLNSRDSIRLNEAKQQGTEDSYSRGVNCQRVVKTIRLDDYINENNIEHIDLLKIDTQGFEPEVLHGMGEYLKNVNVVLTELMLYDLYERSVSFTDIERFLIPAGFKLYDISECSKNPMNGRTDWVDLIYVNEHSLM